MFYFKFEVKWGDLVSAINLDGGIVGLWFVGQKHFPDIPEDAVWLEKDDLNYSEDMKTLYQSMNQVKFQLKSYEKGELKAFDLKLSPKGTVFQKLVWAELINIPYGESRTYGAIGKIVAKKMGRSSMSSQAVGGAVGRNPISIVVPCHRVLGSDGSLTGYAGGLDKKSELLIHEGLKQEIQLSFIFD